MGFNRDDQTYNMGEIPTMGKVVICIRPLKTFKISFIFYILKCKFSILTQSPKGVGMDCFWQSI